MIDLLGAGSRWLTQQMARFVSTPVLYRRGSVEATVAATVGRTAYEVDDDYGLRVGAHVTDFLIATQAFPFDRPRAGDQIVLGSTTYEVMALAGQGVWRWSDPDGTLLRIHAREVDGP